MEDNQVLYLKRGDLEFILEIRIIDEKTKALMTMTEIDGTEKHKNIVDLPEMKKTNTLFGMFKTIEEWKYDIEHIGDGKDAVEHEELGFDFIN